VGEIHVLLQTYYRVCQNFDNRTAFDEVRGKNMVAGCF